LDSEPRDKTAKAIELAADSLAAGGAAALGLFVPPEAAVAAWAAAPLFAAGAKAIAHRLRDTEDELLRESGLSPQEILGRLQSNPRLMDIYMRVADQAWRTSMVEKRAALARSLAHALNDDAKIDEADRLTRIYAAIEAPEVKALAVIERAFLDRGDIDATNHVDLTDLAGHFGGDVALTAGAAWTLYSLGLIEPAGGHNVVPSAYAITELGRLVTSDLRQGSTQESEE
jgi:hypothetical protein